MRQRGFTLIELLVIIVIMPFVMVAISGIFATIIRDVPRATRLVQQQTTVLHMLDQVRRDVGRAVRLPEESGGRRADDKTLLIEQPDGLIRWRFDDGQAVRVDAAGDERIWRMPNAVIAWRPWRRHGDICGLEMHSHLQHRVRGQLRTMLPASRVFFMYNCGKGREAG